MDASRAASRMPVYIGQPFLHDAEKRRLDLGQQAPLGQLGRDLKGHRDAAALREPLNVPAEGRWQPRLIEHRWVQQVREGTDLALALLDQLVALLERARGRNGDVRDQAQRPADVERDGGQVLRGGIVQVARDPSPLAVLRSEQLTGETAQLLRPSLQLVDVRDSADPLLGSSDGVVDWPPPSDKPAVSPIRRADAAFFREALAGRRRD